MVLSSNQRVRVMPMRSTAHAQVALSLSVCWCRVAAVCSLVMVGWRSNVRRPGAGRDCVRVCPGPSAGVGWPCRCKTIAFWFWFLVWCIGACGACMNLLTSCRLRLPSIHPFIHRLRTATSHGWMDMMGHPAVSAACAGNLASHSFTHPHVPSTSPGSRLQGASPITLAISQAT